MLSSAMGAERIPGIEVAEGRMSLDATRSSSGSQGLGKGILGRKQHEQRRRRVKVWQAGKCTQLAAEVCGTWHVGKRSSRMSLETEVRLLQSTLHLLSSVKGR